VHIGDLDGSVSSQRSAWTASVSVTVHNEAHGPLAGASVSGNWNGGATGSGSCVTGATGSCIVTKSGIRKKSGTVTFTVSSVSQSGLTYASGSNHDPDGDSNGTAITVAK
jgi:serine protease AprX